MNSVIIAERLREARTSAKLTQAELSKKAKVTAATISAYENTDEKKRKNPSLENAYKLSRALNVSLDWLCGNDSYTKQSETEQLLKALMALVFRGTKAEINYEHFDSYNMAYSELCIVFSPSSKLVEYLHKVLDLKDVQDKGILPTDMMNTLMESTIDKYKDMELDELTRDNPSEFDQLPME